VDHYSFEGSYMAAVDLHELSGAFALDALDGDELTLFEAHLTECPECVSEVERFHAAAAWLGSTVETTPPSHLAAAVMATAATRRQVSPHEDVADDSRGIGRPGLDGIDVILSDEEGAAAAAVPLHDSGLSRARRRVMRRWVAVPAVAAVAAALTVVSVRLVQADQRLAHYREIADVAAAADAKLVNLSGEAGEVRVVLDRSHRRAVVLSQALPSVEDAQTYELWLLGPGDPRPAGLFRPDSDSRIRHLLDLDMRSDTTGFGVTVEPRKGSLEPTGRVVLSGKV
jgi:hypothetical protein